MGDLLADAILWGTKAPANGGAQISFMNVGGVRSTLLYAPKYTEEPGQITYKEAYDVAPFGNLLVSMDLTGAADQGRPGAAVRRRSTGWSQRPGTRRLGGLRLHVGRLAQRRRQGHRVIDDPQRRADEPGHDLPRLDAQLPRQRW